jgi:peptidoglycan biosynthesis protein MviN/MurJ (putative lipid II flippase)
LKENFKIGMMLYGIAAIFMVGATTPLCTFFFHRGKVSYESLQLIINLTKCFGFAFIGIFIYLMGGTALMADNQRKFYATVGVTNQILVLFLNVTLVRVLGVYIFPISLGIVHFVSGLIMFLKLDINGKKDILLFFLRGIIVILIVTFIYNLANPTGVAKHPFEVLVIDFGTLAVSMPLMALMMGINVRNLAIKTYNKYIRRQR